MKAESSSRPAAYQVNVSEGKAVIRFADNIERIEAEVDGEKIVSYKYDSYTFETTNRQGLAEDVENKFEDWLAAAKQAEYNRLAKEIRAKRNALLADTDKYFTFDRLGITFPDKITASTLLAVVKTICTELAAACSCQMAVYRQALRDIPQQEGFPYDVKFPSKPNN